MPFLHGGRTFLTLLELFLFLTDHTSRWIVGTALFDLLLPADGD